MLALLHLPGSLRTVSPSPKSLVLYRFKYIAELYDAIRTAIPTLIEMLGVNDWFVQSAGVSALAELSKNSEL